MITTAKFRVSSASSRHMAVVVFVERIAKQYIGERHAEVEAYRQMNGIDSPCHACGTRDRLTHHTFGMARILSTKRDWTEAAVSIGVSVITVPLFGIGRLSGPARTHTAQVVRLQLVLCHRCLDQRKGLFGAMNLRKKDCALQPRFEHVRALGYTKLITPDELGQWKPAG